MKQFGDVIGKKKIDEKEETVWKRIEEKSAKRAGANDRLTVDPSLASLFQSGNILACISSRLGLCGGSGEYILKGKELDFYAKETHPASDAKRRRRQPSNIYFLFGQYTCPLHFLSSFSVHVRTREAHASS
eukprot:Plantae.Rhodophyta-Palmaria_palmata.ctg4355.p2 GENE.Plantae.Rhodophyta-Palmaria_palmata.ctg4355~~Plantae.Rhodophyta-Palmaria_palmata.ctg4355.p2  ORF type:complete len:131 (+),score=21.05 Plantae.Rhodophyta-Palmaria_palmata.ctg4355:302-694(+)